MTLKDLNEYQEAIRRDIFDLIDAVCFYEGGCYECRHSKCPSQIMLESYGRIADACTEIAERMKEDDREECGLQEDSEALRIEEPTE